MSSIDTLLQSRVATKDSSKIKALARQSAEGSLSGFSGLFRTNELSELEKATLQTILVEHRLGDESIERDLTQLISITSEVKAIHNQATLLHGERIQRAQTLLKHYKEGAFTAWLYQAYGNRQTPYNFLFYFQFFQLLPEDLKTRAETMPRKAIYLLSGRDAPIEKKLDIVRAYTPEQKQQISDIIRSSFPIAVDDKRRGNQKEVIVQHLLKLIKSYKQYAKEINKNGREEIRDMLKTFLTAVEK